MSDHPPSTFGLIETAIYVDDLDAAQEFYCDLLGLKLLSKEPGRHAFFVASDASVLLAFLPDVTKRGDRLPPHGTTGAGHFAIGIRVEDLDAWRNRMLERGVPIEQEYQWPRGGQSLYFRDPAGNLAELVTPGIWGLPSGW